GAQSNPGSASRQKGVVWDDYQSDGRAEAGRRAKSAGVYPGRKMILPIVQYGDPVLRTRGKPVEQIDDQIRELAANMLETMHAASGVGLAAQQVGEALQLAVLDISPVEDRPSTLKIDGKNVPDAKSAMPLVLINPEVELQGETEVGIEGCLSFPEITGEVERAQSVWVRAQTLNGGIIEMEAGGFLARAIQHEHLQGILFIDRMNSAVKAALASRLKRLQKETRHGTRHREALVSETTL